MKTTIKISIEGGKKAGFTMASGTYESYAGTGVQPSPAQKN
jgi:hypothetical protein